MKQKWKVFLGIFIFSFFLLGNKTTVEASAINTYRAMNVGETETMEIATEEDVIFSTYNKRIATVSEDGTITAVSQGSTVIKAETESQNYYCRITVKKPSLKLSKKTAVVYYGGNTGNSIQLRATVSGADNLVQWESSEPSVAMVDCIGKITALSEGTTVVTATTNGLCAECVITVKETKLTLPVANIQIGTNGAGSSYQFFPSVIGQNQKVTWSSSDKNIATVSAGGKVTGKKSGTAVITATANGISASCKVTVLADSVAINKEQVTLYTGGNSVHSVKLTATANGKKQAALWTSSDETVATVDENGNVTATGEGEAVITASYKGTTDSCKVSVKTTETVLDNTELSLNTKGTDSSAWLKATVTGSKTNIKWTSSDSSVASVSGGKVRGKKTGTATITATANGISATCIVDVTSTSISMARTATLDADTIGTLTLNPVVSGLSQEIMWKSSNNAIATVENGVVTPIKQGTVTITATANGVSSSCRVTVKKADISLKQQEITLYAGTNKGNTATLKATVVGTNKTVEWTSSDSSVVTVDTKGRLTAMNEGTATITATANGKTAQCEVTVFDTNLILNKQEMELTKDYYHHTETLTAEVTGIYKGVSWKTSDSRVATVSKGVITAKGTGTATITATANGVSATCIVTVVETKDEEPTIVLNESSVLLTKNSRTNKSFTLTAMVTGASNAVTWTSSEPSVVTVGKGTLIAKGTGTATITATANGKTAECEVEVTENRIVFDQTALSLNTDGDNTSAVLRATVEGTCRDAVVWKSSNTRVATIDQNGKMAAVAKGTATITASVNGVSASCKVNVIANSISLNKKTAALYVGGNGINTITLKSTVKGASKEVHWTSSDETVAMVDENGKVTAFQPGACVISAEANGITARCDVSVIGNLLELSDTEMTLQTKGSYITDTIIPTVSGASSKITWKSEDNSVATVKDGIVTAKGAGETIITATANGITKECHVYVIEPSITLLESATIYLAEKEGQPVSMELCPVISGKDTEVTWYSKDASVATVENGIITSVSAGTTTISATANGVTASCVVTVEDNHDHVYEWVVEKEAGCETEGIQNYTCSICGKVEASEPIEALGHDYVAATTEPTCTQQGYTTYTCSRCGDNYVDDYTDALGHDWGEWVITKEPTETATGEKKHVCNRCQKEEKEILPKSEHVHKYTTYVKEATCTNSGYIRYTCSCGYSYREDTSALGHEAGEWVHIKEATCTSSGYDKKYCIRCKKFMESQEIPALGHDYKMKEVVEPTNCGEGYTVYECSRCGLTERRDKVPMTGDGEHEYDYYNVELWDDNYYEVDCKYCDYFCLLTMDKILKYREVDTKVKEIIGNIITDDMCDAEKVLAVNNWICLNCYYDYGTYNGTNKDTDSYGEYGAIVKGKAVCAGYSSAFKVFMNELGIECRYVRSDSLNHAWNQVKLDDGWYWIDCTWNDYDIEDFYYNTYFLRTGQRTEDEEGGTICNGTKWVDWLPLYEKYRVSNSSEINKVYEMQKDNYGIYFLFDSEEDYKKIWSISSEYYDKYNESLHTFVHNKEKYLIVIKDTEQLKSFFEERISDDTCEQEHPSVDTAIPMEQIEEISESEESTEEDVSTEEESLVEENLDIQEESSVEENPDTQEESSEETTSTEDNTNEEVLDQTSTEESTEEKSSVEETDIADDSVEEP